MTIASLTGSAGGPAGTVRRGGSFIYEEFLATGGTDVKVCS